MHELISTDGAKILHLYDNNFKTNYMYTDCYYIQFSSLHIFTLKTLNTL